MSIFEIIMLLCFGAAWPVSIIKSIRTRSTGGKSLFFLIIIIIGYISGIAHKLLYNPDFVVWLYILNAIMVSVDVVLWILNRRRGKTGVAGQAEAALETQEFPKQSKSRPTETKLTTLALAVCLAGKE